MAALKMKNEFRCVGGTREPVGTAGESVFWADRELRCPDCGRWTRDFGDVTASNDDGTHSYICEACVTENWVEA